MITIARLKLRNWKPFRGEHVIDLEPKAYAIFARKDGNPDSSNFAGKSSVLEAVDFALYGRLSDEFKNKRRGWISRGEKSGEVELQLSDGSRVVRSQQLSGSERLWYFPPGEPEKGATQDGAQQRIDELVGLSREDFAATRYFPQGQMARLLTLDPTPRLKLVVGWLRLGPLQDCEADAAEALRELARRRDEASLRARAAKEEAERVLARFREAPLNPLEVVRGVDGPAGEAHLDSLIALAESDLRHAEEQLAGARAAAEKDRERVELAPHAERYERVVREGVELRASLERVPRPAELQAAADEARARLKVLGERKGVAEGDERSKVSLARGSFDGGCPLVGAPCPAREFVVGGRRRNEENAALARDAAEEARRAYEGAARGAQEAQEALRQRSLADARLEALRAEGRRLKPSADRLAALPAGEVADGRAVTVAEGVVRGATERVSVLRAARSQVADLGQREAEARAEAERLERAVRVAAAGTAIFGPAGAQRRLAEGPLGDIEAAACEELAQAAAGLQVAVRWSREGSGLASTCGACGEPFPRSEKIKSCGRCGGARGQQIVNALTIEPSAVSGGAKDLAGVFVQLAVAAWLVEDRGARWATALLDEPLAALDAHVRRQLASHLPAILRRSGVAQAIVSGHDRAALDTLPGRIMVESEGGWSRCSVVA